MLTDISSCSWKINVNVDRPPETFTAGIVGLIVRAPHTRRSPCTPEYSSYTTSRPGLSWLEWHCAILSNHVNHALNAMDKEILPVL